MSGSEELEFLKNVKDNMPYINSQLDFLCCQTTIDAALPECAVVSAKNIL